MRYNFQLIEFLGGHVIGSYPARAVMIGDPIDNPTPGGPKHDWELDAIEIRVEGSTWLKLPPTHRLHEFAVNILHDERREIDRAWGEYLEVAA